MSFIFTFSRHRRYPGIGAGCLPSNQEGKVPVGALTEGGSCPLNTDITLSVISPYVYFLRIFPLLLYSNSGK